jgi:predicted Zn finger-like uncharacterized protein
VRALQCDAMSLITRCPACTTMFKVVPDQLRISDGWVRCGQCDEVFDANAQLQSDLSSSVAEPPAMAASEVIPQSEVVASPEVLSVQTYDVQLPDDEPAPDESFKIPADWPSEEDAAFADPFLEKSPQELSQLHGPSVERGPEVIAPSHFDAELAAASNVAAQPRYQQSTVSAQTLEGEAKLSFLHTHKKTARRSSPWARGAMALFGVVLAGGLVLQVVMQERDRLAASEPGLVPALASLCAALHCKLEPLRQIESVVIDSSAFTKVRTDVYRLSFTLKNAAPTDVAIPAVELTLTDAQDQAVVRRVFPSGDFRAQRDAMATGTELPVALPVNVKLPTGSERIAGYRLLAFYP